MYVQEIPESLKMRNMNQAQRKRLIRNAENIIASLTSDEHDEQLTIAINAVQVFLDNKIGLASDVHLVRRLAALADKAMNLDAQEAGETG